MIEKGVFLTGDEAELLNRALAEVKTKAFEVSELTLDDTQALGALVSSLSKDGEEKETRSESPNPLSKRLFLGTIMLGTTARTVLYPSRAAAPGRLKRLSLGVS